MDVDIQFRQLNCECQHAVHIYLVFILDVALKLFHYGCRYPVETIELRMSTFSLHVLSFNS